MIVRCILFCVILLTIWLSSSMGCGAREGQIGLSETERWIVEQVKKGAAANVSVHCAASNEANNCTTVSSKFLYRLLGGEFSQSDDEIILEGANLKELVEISGLLVPNRTNLIRCEFTLPFVATGAHFANDLILDGSIFDQGFDADNLHVDGQFFIRNHAVIRAKSFNLTNAFLKSDVTIANSDFESQLIMRRASVGEKFLLQSSFFHDGVDADFLSVGGPLDVGVGVNVSNRFFSLKAASINGRFYILNSNLSHGAYFADISVKGGLSIVGTTISDRFVDISGAQILGDLRFRDATLSNKLNLALSKIDGSLLFLDKSSFGGRVSVNDSRVGNDIQVSGAKLGGGLDGDRIRVGGSIEFGGGAIVGSTTFLDSTVGVDLSLSNALLIDCPDLAVDAEGGSAPNRAASFFAKGMRIGGTAYFGPRLLERSGSLNLLEMDVAGNIEISDAIFHDKVLAQLMRVGQSIFVHESIFNSGLVMNGIIVAQHLDMAGNKFYGDIDLARSSVGRDFRLADGGRHEYKWDTTFADNVALDLRSAQVGMVQDEFGWRGHPEPWPNIVRLEGFLYGSFGNVRDVGWAEEWLARQPQRESYHSPSTQFNEQPYKELAAYFKSIGDEEGGDQILHDARDRELADYWGACHWGALDSCLHAAELWLFDIGINYGVGPWQIRTLLWIFIFTTAGVEILRWSPPHRYLGFWWRLGASLNRLIPVLELRKEFTEFFERRNALRSWQKTYFAIHAIVGFMLASFILAALAGLTPSK